MAEGRGGWSACRLRHVQDSKCSLQLLLSFQIYLCKIKRTIKTNLDRMKFLNSVFSWTGRSIILNNRNVQRYVCYTLTDKNNFFVVIVFNIPQEPKLNVYISAWLLLHIMLYFKTNSRLITETHKNCYKQITLLGIKLFLSILLYRTIH